MRTIKTYRKVGAFYIAWEEDLSTPIRIDPTLEPTNNYCSFAYSALASLRMGMSGSASFQRVRKSWEAARAGTRAASASAPCEGLAKVWACSALARATPRCPRAPVQQFHTIPL